MEFEQDIHPTAIIHSQAKLDKGVKVGPYSVIGKSVEIGESTEIGGHVNITGHTKIGKSNKIFHYSSIGEQPQDMKYKDQETFLEIGHRNTIREFCTVNTGTAEGNEKTIIGNDNWIMAYVHIAHDCNIGNNVILVNSVQLGGHITIGNHAIIGGLSAIHQFVKIGKNCMISGGSLVRKDVPPFTKAAREPLSFVGINSIGLRRKGFEHKKIIEIQDIYRILYQSNLNTTQALNKLELDFPVSDERDEIINFINKSGRGLMKGYKQ